MSEDYTEEYINYLVSTEILSNPTLDIKMIPINPTFVVIISSEKHKVEVDGNEIEPRRYLDYFVYIVRNDTFKVDGAKYKTDVKEDEDGSEKIIVKKIRETISVRQLIRR